MTRRTPRRLIVGIVRFRFTLVVVVVMTLFLFGFGGDGGDDGRESMGQKGGYTL